MKIAITPGPWRQPMRYAPDAGMDVPAGHVEDIMGRIIAVVSIVNGPISEDGLKEWAANARAIAAVPDMISALLSVRDRLTAWIDGERKAQISAESCAAWDRAEGHGNTIANYEALVSIIDAALEAATEEER